MSGVAHSLRACSLSPAARFFRKTLDVVEQRGARLGVGLRLVPPRHCALELQGAKVQMAGALDERHPSKIDRTSEEALFRVANPGVQRLGSCFHRSYATL